MCCLCLGFVWSSLEPVKVRQLFPVVVFIFVRVVMVGADNIIGSFSLRLLWLCSSELVDEDVR